MVGDKVIAAMLRENANDFRANITNGGTATDYTDKVSSAWKQMALDACRVLGLDFAGVDILFGPDDEPVLCEVNSNAHFKNLYDCTGINAAEAIMEHIVKDPSLRSGRQHTTVRVILRALARRILKDYINIRGVYLS